MGLIWKWIQLCRELIKGGHVYCYCARGTSLTVTGVNPHSLGAQNPLSPAGFVATPTAWFDRHGDWLPSIRCNSLSFTGTEVVDRIHVPNRMVSALPNVGT